jgi:hypothetical protein
MGIVSDYREMLDQMRDEEALNWQTRSTDTVLTADRKPCPGCGTPYGGLHGAVCPERERLRAQVRVKFEADNVGDYREKLEQMRDEERAAGYSCPDCGAPEGYEHDELCLSLQRAAINEAAREGDLVNHPPHYKHGNIECIDAIEAALTEEEFRGYCKGNALKYVWRERHKGQDESLRKAVWYLNRALGE